MEEIYEQLKERMNENYLEWEEVRTWLLPCLKRINKETPVDFEMGIEIMEKLKIVIPNTHIAKMGVIKFVGFEDEDKSFVFLLNMWCEGFGMAKVWNKK